jgi:hypothetical protein
MHRIAWRARLSRIPLIIILIVLLLLFGGGGYYMGRISAITAVVALASFWRL